MSQCDVTYVRIGNRMETSTFRDLHTKHRNQKKKGKHNLSNVKLVSENMRYTERHAKQLVHYIHILQKEGPKYGTIPIPMICSNTAAPH